MRSEIAILRAKANLQLQLRQSVKQNFANKMMAVFKTPI